ncbi:MAG: HD domain-containing protein [Clostridia bacterium]|nr:HD domain-containing protein [Clostridia bacterium]
MLSKQLILLLHQGASIQRWNEHFRPHKGFTELDKQAHKAFFMYVLHKLDDSADPVKLIEGCIFEYLHRVILTDIKPPVFHKMMHEKGKQINRWVLDELRGACEDIENGFYGRFEQYLLDENYAAHEKRIISAAHYLATSWEFDIVYRMSSFLYGIEDTKAQIESEIAAFFDLEAVQKYYGNYKLKNFMNLVGQLRLQQRWARCTRAMETSVMGHMLIVAIFSYLFSLKVGGCRERLCNNFFGGLFHDLPEVLTRDIVSPVKNSVAGLDDIIKEMENGAIAKSILPLIPEDWHGEIMYFMHDEFKSKYIDNGKIVFSESDEINKKFNDDKYKPIDGQLIRGADHLSAFIEAALSIHYGISSEPLANGRDSIRRTYKNKVIAGIDFGEFYTMFDDDADKI